MKNEFNIDAIADYLSNALDRDSDEEMVSFLVQEFSISELPARKLVESWIEKFSKSPIILIDDAQRFLADTLK